MPTNTTPSTVTRQAINDQMEKELRSILTPEQAKRLDEMEARRPPEPCGFMHPGAFPPPP